MSLCWLCYDSFETEGLLKRHLVSAPHSRMSVICPFCTTSEKTVARMNDLRRHVQRTHVDLFEDLPSTFFHEDNGFWLSMYPEDHSKLASTNEYNCPAAYSARQSVLNWVMAVPRSSRSLEQWQSGWEMETASEPPHKRQAVEYTPTKPHVSASDLSVVDIQFQNRQFIVTFATNPRTLLVVTLLCIAPDDERYVVSLTRRMMANQDTGDVHQAPKENGVKLRGQVLLTAQNAVADALNIPARLIESVIEQQNEWAGYRTPSIDLTRPTSTPLTTPVPSPVSPSPVSPLSKERPSVIQRLPRPFPSSTVGPTAAFQPIAIPQCSNVVTAPAVTIPPDYYSVRRFSPVTCETPLPLRAITRECRQ